LVAGVTVVEDLDRDSPSQLLVLGEVHVRHSPRAQLAHDAVTPVEERVDELVGYCHSECLFSECCRPSRSRAPSDTRTQGVSLAEAIGTSEDAVARRALAGEKPDDLRWRGTEP